MINTKDKIKNTFLELYCSNDIEKIKVNTICKMTNISRTTFYKNFNKVDDILKEIELSVYDYFDLLKRKLPNIDVCLLKDKELATNILEIYKYILDNRKIFKAFFSKDKEHLIIIKIKKKIKSNLKHTYYKYFNDDETFSCFQEMIATNLINNSLIIIDYYNIINLESLTIKTQREIKDLIINKNNYFKKETVIN